MRRYTRVQENPENHRIGVIYGAEKGEYGDIELEMIFCPHYRCTLSLDTCWKRKRAKRAGSWRNRVSSYPRCIDCSIPEEAS